MAREKCKGAPAVPRPGDTVRFRDESRASDFVRKHEWTVLGDNSLGRFKLHSDGYAQEFPNDVRGIFTHAAKSDVFLIRRAPSASGGEVQPKAEPEEWKVGDYATGHNVHSWRYGRSELEELASRKNQEFGGEAHLTNEELDRLLAAARFALRCEGFLREHWSCLPGPLLEASVSLAVSGVPDAAEQARAHRAAYVALLELMKALPTRTEGT